MSKIVRINNIGYIHKETTAIINTIIKKQITKLSFI